MNGEAKSKNFIEKVLIQLFPDKLAGTTYQFIKCSAVGASNTLIDLAVLNLLIFLTGVKTGIYVAVFAGISFIAADVNSFLLNKFWTFKDRKKNSQELMKQIIVFLLVSLTGLAINIFVVNLIVNIAGLQYGMINKLFVIINNTGLRWNIDKIAWVWANIGKFCAVFLTIVWNFTGYKLIVFKN